MVNAFRYGMLGASDVSINVAFTIILSAFVGLFVLALILLHKGSGIRS
jgi:ABC-2 type transport system permease protein